MEPDRTLCYCFHIPKRKIVGFVKQTRPRRASQIAECFGAGTGCGWCIPFLEAIHRKVMEGESDLDDDHTPAEYEAMRERYREDVRSGRRSKNALSRPSAEPESECAAPRSVDSMSDLADEWDVSDYFSRPSRSDPEPDELTE